MSAVSLALRSYQLSREQSKNTLLLPVACRPETSQSGIDTSDTSTRSTITGSSCSFGFTSADSSRAPSTERTPCSPPRKRCKSADLFPERSLETSEYTFVDDITQVTQGVIKLATDATGESRCVKCFDKSKMQTDTLKQMRSEVELMFELGRHPNIGTAIEGFQDSGFYYLVQPYYRGGNLVNLKARAVGAGVLPIEDWWTGIVRQCLVGLSHMHAQGVTHCDIKEHNIMITGEDLWEPEVVIIDLGVAQHSSTQRSIIYGTPGYIAPEVWEGKNWHPQSDMFSMGVVIVQMLIGKMGIFTEGTSTYKEVEDATKNRLPPFDLMPLEFPSLKWLAQKLLAQDFKSRPSAASAWFRMLREPWKDTSIVESVDHQSQQWHTSCQPLSVDVQLPELKQILHHPDEMKKKLASDQQLAQTIASPRTTCSTSSRTVATSRPSLIHSVQTPTATRFGTHRLSTMGVTQSVPVQSFRFTHRRVMTR